ncbi:hypothetical protein ERO13_A02G023602v2 [Gossypium hirsutum]|uniref:Uncharacterized protein n=1 Tax=Gossypium darwinii TaxID=34276 RepID=A0A5D2HAL9_GOSDA|nr:hypothetical protein ERO13_A02G023602v2 [Gossypium hirsutum]TYH26960.1 hypothetical protein ES288_A02G031100v1 [Gossypium darwinii]
MLIFFPFCYTGSREKIPSVIFPSLCYFPITFDYIIVILSVVNPSVLLAVPCSCDISLRSIYHLVEIL